jgi:hypothetical protein
MEELLRMGAESCGSMKTTAATKPKAEALQYQ